MLRVFKAAILSICILTIIALGVFKFDPQHMVGASVSSYALVATPRTLAASVTAKKNAPGSAFAGSQGSQRNSQTVVVKKQATGSAFADGPYTVQGNAIVG